MKDNKIGSLILWYLPVLLVQIVSGMVTANSINPWYQSLEKAFWNPPSWVFGPAWTILYLMMTVSVWMISCSEAPKKEKRTAYVLFFSQLFINGLWSFLFFGLHMPGLALIDLGLLIILVSTTILYFFYIRPSAAFLMIPYLLWILYAFSLNAAIWWLN